MILEFSTGNANMQLVVSWKCATYFFVFDSHIYLSQSLNVFQTQPKYLMIHVCRDWGLQESIAMSSPTKLDNLLYV